jgi:hypothetical protein
MLTVKQCQVLAENVPYLSGIQLQWNGKSLAKFVCCGFMEC